MYDNIVVGHCGVGFVRSASVVIKTYVLRQFCACAGWNLLTKMSRKKKKKIIQYVPVWRFQNPAILFYKWIIYC